MRQEFMDYVDRMKKVRSLSTPSLDSIAGAEDYSKVLLENFKQIGCLATENRETVKTILLPILESDRPLSDEEAEELSELNEQLFDMVNLEEIDQHVADMINERLVVEELKNATSENYDELKIVGIGRTMQIKYFLMAISQNRNLEAVEKYRKEGLAELEKLQAYLEKDKFTKLSEDMRVQVLGNALSGTLLYETNERNAKLEYLEKSMELLRQALAISQDPFYLKSAKIRWENYEYLIYYYMSGLAEVSILPKETAKEIFQYSPRMVELWNSDPEYFSEAYPDVNLAWLKCEILKVALRAEDPSVGERFDELYKIYQERDVLDYGSIGVAMNLSLPATLYKVLAEKYKNLVGLKERDLSKMNEFAREMLAYVHHMPKGGSLVNGTTVFSGLLESYLEIPGQLSYEELCIQTLAAVHPPTFIHSNMVAKITSCLVRHLLKRSPELFASFPGTGSRETVLEKSSEIVSFAYHSALCHDLGKTMIIDTIGMYGRHLLDSEYFDLKQHPENGAMMAANHDSTKEYVDVIKGHHVWYDGSKGYPTDFDVTKSPYKVIIDVVMAADCLDAATDSVGRSYNKGKSLEDFEKELTEGAGTRYAPFLPGLFADPEVRQDLEYLLSEGRSKLYQDTFYLLRQMTK